MQHTNMGRRTLLAAVWASCFLLDVSLGLSIQSSVFLGRPVVATGIGDSSDHCRRRGEVNNIASSWLVMRKQKASDKRTRRRQRHGNDEATSAAGLTLLPETMTASPMHQAGTWNDKKIYDNSGIATRSTTSATRTTSTANQAVSYAATAATAIGSHSHNHRSPGSGGRGRSRKRSTLYESVSFYHNKFLKLLTDEYQAEEQEVLGRIKASVDDPLGLEAAGYALFDLYPTRRGNLFADEVYRLTKAGDATSVYERENDDHGGRSANNDANSSNSNVRYFPANHKFSINDVVTLTLQPKGSGDFFDPQGAGLPTNSDASVVEARVLGVGQTYVDVAVAAGGFEAALGAPAPNDMSGKGDKSMRLRADCFFSRVPYDRMVSALAQLTSTSSSTSGIQRQQLQNDKRKSSEKKQPPPSQGVTMDETLRDLILSTHAFSDPASPLLHEPGVCDLQEISNRLAKRPMPNSHNLAVQAMKYMRSNPQGLFAKFNSPQMAAIGAALTRRLTLIQGPPGTGKTTTAAAIAFGFVYQCRSLTPNTKVLACAFSNVGADNLAEALIRLGVKVVRVGKPSAIMESLWDNTLDAAISRDPEAQKALKSAAKATAQLSKLNRDGKKRKNAGVSLTERTIRDAATAAVKKSIQASNIAATAALREADVIVSTSTGAADPRLLAACGIITGEDEDDVSSKRLVGKLKRGSPTDDARDNAPDGGPPLTLPFVLVDEACQSVEPASLIPIISSNSCRSLVLLGDPCQLPPTVKTGSNSPLSVSLMERLAAALPRPDVKFAGSLLLSIQYRMHPSIAALPSAIFYDGLLATPEFLKHDRSFPESLQRMMPCADPKLCVRMLDVGGRFNERRGSPSKISRTVFGVNNNIVEEQTSYWNEAEAERVLSLIKDVLQDDPSVNSIGVVTPYNAQVQLIKGMMARDPEIKELLLGRPATTIEVKSVDGYQGRERDVVIFSTVRSNRQGNIGFLADWRRMNVALTRAKSGLVVVGDLETLREHDKHWDAFAKWATSIRCVVDDYDCPEDEPSL